MNFDPRTIFQQMTDRGGGSELRAPNRRAEDLYQFHGTTKSYFGFEDPILTVSIGSTQVTAEWAQRMVAGLGALPLPLKAQLKENGLTIFLDHGNRPIYDAGGNAVYFGDYKAIGLDQKWSGQKDPRHDCLHEVGHAFDDLLGQRSKGHFGLSSTFAFQQAWRADIQTNFSAEDRNMLFDPALRTSNWLHYYAQGGIGDAPQPYGRRETLAECFNILAQRNAGFGDPNNGMFDKFKFCLAHVEKLMLAFNR